jgi:hypothetical protein
VRPKVLVGLCIVLLIAARCTSDGDGSRPPATRPRALPPKQAGPFELGHGCSGLRELEGTQISFVSGGKLFVAGRRGSLARCVVPVSRPTDIEWGPQADRLHFGDLRRYDGGRIASLSGETQSVAWSRPTGSSIVYVSGGGRDSRGLLMKVDAFGAEASDISFLADHDEAVYHPAGTHLAVTGTARDGTYGLWLATNLGEERQLLAIGEDARRIFSLSFSQDGTRIYYAAEHDHRHDVHSLRLALEDSEGRIRNAELKTIQSAPTAMADVIAPLRGSHRIAYSVGSCEEKKMTRVWNGAVVELGGRLVDQSTEPIGWLPGGELLVLARADGCSGPGSLYAWQVRADRITPLADGVVAAAVRSVLPPPPPPPGSEQEVLA